MNENPLHANTQTNLELEGYTDDPPQLSPSLVLCVQSLFMPFYSVLGGTIFLAYSSFEIFFRGGWFNLEGRWAFFALGTYACLLLVWFIVDMPVLTDIIGPVKTMEGRDIQSVYRICQCKNKNTFS